MNSLPFLEFSFHGLVLDTKMLDNSSHIKAKMSLQEYEVYEVTPVPIGKNSSMQRISSAASFGLPYTYSQVFSQDGSEQKERATHSPCPSTFDTIGANDVRNGLKYTRLISRRVYVNQQQQQNNGKIYSHFFSGKLSKNSSRSLQSMTGIKGLNNNNSNNIYNSYNQYEKRGVPKYDAQTDTHNIDTLAPLLLLEVELKLRKSKKRTRTLNTLKMKSANSVVREDYKKSKHGEELDGREDRDRDKRVDDRKKGGHDREKGDEEGGEREEDEQVKGGGGGGGGGGSCRLSMEELEILCCPSAHWIAALGTFLVLSPVPEIR